jgi:HAD superfamily hydrolase (TIGR01509 family)
MSDQAVSPAAVLWDMDGTLIDSEKLWTIALCELAGWLGGSLSQAARDAMVGSNMDRTMRILLAEVGKLPEPAIMAEGTAWLDNRARELFEDGLDWRPGAREALVAVRAAGFATALVTSTERRLTEIALRTIGSEFFDVTVCGDEVDGQNKPLPEPYLRAARLLGVDPGDCVAVEDSPTGAVSAEAAGCTVLVVPSETAVAPGERRVLRESLVGVDAAFFTELLEAEAA